VILYRPAGLIGVLTDITARVVKAGQARTKEAPLDG